jgi:hypothetical protein
MAGAPPGFSERIDRKYDILQQQADAQTGLENAQASVLPGDAAARQALQRAQAFQTNQTAQQVAPLAQAQLQQTQAGIGETGARAGYYGALGRATLDPLSAPSALELHSFATQYGYPSGRLNVQPGANGGLTGTQGGEAAGGLAPGAFSADNKLHLDGGEPGYSKGTAKVPGKPNGNKDTVKAKLAPGEAVLNKGAAEHMGRGLIGVLNAIGQHKMETQGEPGTTGSSFPQPNAGVQPMGSANQAQAFAKGTPKVGKGKSAPNPAMPPAGLQAIMAMMQNGGGMPGAMPMSTPGAARTGGSMARKGMP